MSPAFVPYFTDVLNRSLSTGEVPATFKEAIVTPILKKPSLCPEVLANYRPVSNLNFVSKVLEKAVAIRIKDHLTTNGLLEPLQSAYRQFHSTETALVKIHSDLAVALDKNKICLLILLDMSASFDTIDHGILLKCYETYFGISEKVLNWLRTSEKL